MAADSRVQFAGPGCIVECMQGNKPVQFWVLETQGDSVRLLNASRRESKAPVSRLLPWLGPSYPGEHSRQDMADLLEKHRLRREELSSGLNMDDIWDLAQGELEHAPARWFAELCWETPDPDQVAAMGHALLACKSHFKFSPPTFEIYGAQRVARRLEEQEAVKKREEFTGLGAEFFRLLWDIHCHRRNGLAERETPPEPLVSQLREMLLARLADPETHDADGAWKLLTKGLPEDAHLPLHLAQAWGLVPEHHNFWLDRAGFDPAPDWAAPFTADLDGLRRCLEQPVEAFDAPGPLVSIDAADTRDVDDAGFTRRESGGFSTTLAFSCPALCWPFGSGLDKAVLRRASSLYLPEGDLHMLPEELGLGSFSLLAGRERPALVLQARLDGQGALLELTPRLVRTKVSANLTFEAAQHLLAPQPDLVPVEAELESARPHLPMLRDALALAELLRARRLEAGAVVTDRPDPKLDLERDENGLLRISLFCPPACSASQLLVSEMMIFANSALASWALERKIPLLYRTQDVALPKEFFGVWTRPEDIARVVRHLPAAGLESAPARHAGLGLTAYATLTSPLRRYVDLINEAQIVHYLAHGTPRLDQDELNALLPYISARLEQVGQVQRFRPRYWKLAYFRQMGDNAWWDGVITEENDLFATVSLPFAQLFIRVRRRFLDEKTYVGQAVRVRLGKINPLANEIQVLEVMER